MKILVVGDCHGEIPEIPDTDFDVILGVGDFCGGTEEMRDAMFQAVDSEKAWHQIMGEQNAREEVEKSVEEGLAVLEELHMQDVPVFVVPGNWDWSGELYDWDFLYDKGFDHVIDQFDNIEGINMASRSFGGLNFIGYGPCSSPEIPQYEDDLPEKEELEDMREEFERKKHKLRKLFREADGQTIFLSHNVPHDTVLDEIDNPESPKDGRHYGSLVVRSIIEEFRPYYNVAGHIHEAKGQTTVESTLCINTGLHNTVLIDTDSNDVEFLE